MDKYYEHVIPRRNTFHNSFALLVFNIFALYIVSVVSATSSSMWRLGFGKLMAGRGKADMMLTFKVRACPTRGQHAWLAKCLDHSRDLYNAALDERLGAWQKARKRVTLGEQSKALTELRRDPAYAIFPRRMQRWVLDRVDDACREHVKRLASSNKVKSNIRFRSKAYWRTIGCDSPIDFKMRERGLYQRKMFGGTLRLKRDRELPSWAQCKAVTLTRDDRRWFVNLTYEMPDPARTPRARPRAPIAIDLGLRQSIVRSDGAKINAVGIYGDALPEIRRTSQALARCEKKSKGRQKIKTQLQRLHARIARRRRARLETISARLVRHFDAIAVEDLALRGLMRSGGRNAQGRGIRRKWRDFAPGTLISLIERKCQRDGRNFVRVDPRGTTQECSRCGVRVEKSLQDRVHRCPRCGTVLDRDHNAALNILNRAGWCPGGVNLSDNARNPMQATREIASEIRRGYRAGPRQGGSAASFISAHGNTWWPTTD